MRALRRGASGPDVVRWERFLVAKGHLPRPGSGVFGEATETATRAFQIAAGVEQTGKADAATLAVALQAGLLDNDELEIPVPAATPAPAKRLEWSVLIPLVVAVIGGLFTALVSVLNARSSSQNALAAEREKLRSSIILQAIRTDDATQSLANLRFFAKLGFIDIDEAQLDSLERRPNSVPVLPSEAPKRLSGTEQRALLGGTEFEVVDTRTGDVALDEAWVRDNIVTVQIPQLAGKPVPGGDGFSGAVRIHRAAAPALAAAFADIDRAGLGGDITSFGGSFRPRLISGSVGTLSAHALGIAFDINVTENPFGRPPAPEGTPGSVLRLLPIFERHGFHWGGRDARPDSMHFEFADRAKLSPTQ